MEMRVEDWFSMGWIVCLWRPEVNGAMVEEKINSYGRWMSVLRSLGIIEVEQAST
jgi:hypothetical protein